MANTVVHEFVGHPRLHVGDVARCFERNPGIDPAAAPGAALVDQDNAMRLQGLVKPWRPAIARPRRFSARAALKESQQRQCFATAGGIAYFACKNPDRLPSGFDQSRGTSPYDRVSACPVWSI
ncbi:hypothetical protein HFO97_26605 [Rhizobium leguminosarum]|nr:hypothetical protein [Rhizobium leguminosarum]